MAIVALIPGIDLPFTVAIGAVGALVEYLQHGTLSDYSAALADATLWADMRCAISHAIQADGQVTDANFDAVLTAVSSVPYAHADVVTAMHDYLANLGSAGTQAVQQSGALYVGDCSACSWCWTWDFTVAPSAEWGPLNSGGFDTGHWFSGIGWKADDRAWSGGTQSDLQLVHILAATSAIDSVRIIGYSDGPETHTQYDRCMFVDLTTEYDFTEDAGAIDVTLGVGAAVSRLDISLSTIPKVAGDVWITSIVITGTGVSPYPPSNC
jgi:hypothetical protein